MEMKCCDTVFTLEGESVRSNGFGNITDAVMDIAGFVYAARYTKKSHSPSYFNPLLQVIHTIKLDISASDGFMWEAGLWKRNTLFHSIPGMEVIIHVTF